MKEYTAKQKIDIDLMRQGVERGDAAMHEAWDRWQAYSCGNGQLLTASLRTHAIRKISAMYRDTHAFISQCRRNIHQVAMFGPNGPNLWLISFKVK